MNSPVTSGTRPTLTVIAGPNGSGKSTFTRTLRAASQAPIVDPDAIAREIDPVAPEQAAVAAGREALRREAAYLENGVSFIVETTLSGNTMLRQMEHARQRGFDVRLIFIATDNPRINIGRIVARVARGGHFVPDEDVQRRYMRSMRNLARAIELVDEATIIDNTLEQGPREALRIDAGQITFQAQDLPAWVATHLGAFIARRRDQS